MYLISPEVFATGKARRVTGGIGAKASPTHGFDDFSRVRASRHTVAILNKSITSNILAAAFIEDSSAPKSDAGKAGFESSLAEALRGAAERLAAIVDYIE